MKKALFVLAATAALATPALAAEDMLKFATSKGCTACHTVDKKLIGPSYKEVAAKYKGNKGAAALLVDKVIKGGSGVWGAVPMTPHPTLAKADAQKLVDWVLSLK